MSNFLFFGVGFNPAADADQPVVLIDFSAGQNNDRPVVIFDIDGTISDDAQRAHFIQAKNNKDRDWDGYHAALGKDVIHPKTVDRLIELWNEGFRIVLSTGRPATLLFQTLRWLHEKDLLKFVSELYMRNHRGEYNISNAEFKLKVVELLAESGAVIVEHYDDNPKVASLFKEMNLNIDVRDLNKVQLILPS